jgi:hypothetical protein
MTTYKQHLLGALIDHGWELIEVNDDNHDWWCDEHWRIRSVRENWGLELLIFFLVDPQWEAPRKKGQGVWEIAATTTFLKSWLDADGGIATLTMSKGKFDIKLGQFIASLNEYRRTVQ